jgi:hypothetical protein
MVNEEQSIYRHCCDDSLNPPRFAKANGIPVRYFARGEKKEEVARPFIEAAAAEGGTGKVVLIGIAQEKAPVWRSWPARGQRGAAHPHMEWGRQMAFVNHFYFYLWDREWGGAFWKTNGYAPYPVWIWLNGHEWAKRQLAKAGVGFTALDNGFASCADPVLLQRVCDRLGPGAVTAFFWRWFWRLPSPFTKDDLRAGYGYELAFRQFEVSDTRVFDRSAAGRAFFEGLIRDHLDLGRPDQVSLVFGRNVRLAGPRPTPGTFRTKVITRGVDPEIICYYKSSRLKQYFNCDMRSHAASGCVERRAGLCRGRSPGQRRKTCPRRDVRAGLLGWRVRSSRESPRVPDPSGGHRRGEGRAGVNASELLRMPR